MSRIGPAKGVSTYRDLVQVLVDEDRRVGELGQGRHDEVELRIGDGHGSFSQLRASNAGGELEAVRGAWRTHLLLMLPRLALGRNLRGEEGESGGGNGAHLRLRGVQGAEQVGFELLSLGPPSGTRAKSEL